ncbi:MAG: hypothetical protein ABEH40_00155 [Haloferacaceae archaeon]
MGPGPTTPLQATGGALAVAGTFASLALFLALTAHIAARNVLGDVAARNALAVGAPPAAVAVIVTALDLPPWLGIGCALVIDGLLVARLYGVGRRLGAYITFIHAVVSVILGAIVVSLWLLIRSAPG